MDPTQRHASSLARPTPRTTDHRQPPADLALLDGLAHRLLAGATAALAVSDRRGAVVQTLRLDPSDPLGALVGWTAPLGVDAVGVLVPILVEGPPGHRSGAVAHVCGHDGTHLAAWSGDGRGSRPGTDPLADVCRRALGLATPPPTQPVGQLLTVRWLGSVLAATIGRDLGSPVPAWPEVVALHPVIGDDPTPAASFATATTWGELRRRILVGRLPASRPVVAAAAWFDDGSFSRWILGRHPSPSELWADLGELLPASTIEAMARRLSGLPDEGGRAAGRPMNTATGFGDEGAEITGSRAAGGAIRAVSRRLDPTGPES